MTTPEQPTDTEPARRPSPLDAATVARDSRFIDIVGVALMAVVVEGPPQLGDGDLNDPGLNMARLIVENPARQAERWAFAMATDPTIVAGALASNTADDGGLGVDGLAVLIAKVRALWSVMAGQPVAIDSRDAPTREGGKG